MIRAALIAVLCCAAGAAAAATDCEDVSFQDLSFTACAVDPAVDRLRLWLRAPDGSILGTFDRVDEVLAAEGQRLGIAMNGGMYHDDRRPVGYYVEGHAEEMRLVLNEGPGNFGLLPNGVLCIFDDGRVSVTESRRFAREAPPCRDATQSGPMLVIDGALHPRFRADSTSRNIRNGVGVTPEGKVWLAISNEPVTFHEFASFFRDRLGAPDALYLDGSVSRLYAPAEGRHDIGFPMGPILGTAVDAD